MVTVIFHSAYLAKQSTLTVLSGRFSPGGNEETPFVRSGNKSSTWRFEDIWLPVERSLLGLAIKVLSGSFHT